MDVIPFKSEYIRIVRSIHGFEFKSTRRLINYASSAFQGTVTPPTPKNRCHFRGRSAATICSNRLHFDLAQKKNQRVAINRFLAVS